MFRDRCRVRGFAGLAVAVFAVTAFVVLRPVSASVYEYIKNLYTTTSEPDPSYLRSWTYTSTTYVTVAGGYNEYRTVYWTTSTSENPWTEWTNCRREGYLSGEETATCTNLLPDVRTTSTFYLRASTNYSGCGTWTPTPDEVNCGGTMTNTYTLIPRDI